jgi:hypothetical protein
MFDRESREPRRGGDRGPRGEEDTDLYYYLCHRAKKGSKEPDGLRVKGPGWQAFGIF